MRGRIVIDDSGLRRAVETVRRELNPRTLMDTVGQEFLRWCDEHFRTGGHGSWPALSPNTRAAKGSSNILMDTGRLRGSYRMRVSMNQVDVGPESQIADFHHFGTGPYTIQASAGRVLAFRTASGPMFARSVRHPGLPVRRLVPDEGEASQIAQETIDRMAQVLERRVNA